MAGREHWRACPSVGGLRGTFFEAKLLSQAPSSDECETWETTGYTGSHWIEAFLVKNNVVIARSGRLLVNVKKKGFHFRR